MALEPSTNVHREISCRITKTLLMYVKEQNQGSLKNLLEGLDLDEAYLSDPNNWVSHVFLQILYHRMVAMLGDDNAVYKMALASGRFQSLGLLDGMARLLGSPKTILSQAARYNRLLKLNGDFTVLDLRESWAVVKDRYHASAQKTRYDCDYTRGILEGLPTLFDMPRAEVEEIECQVAPETYGERTWSDAPLQGAEACLYRVHWDSGNRIVLPKRLFGRRTVYRKAIEDLQEANRCLQDKYEEARRLARDLEAANRQLLESKQQLESSAAELRASEERYRFLADNVSDTLWTFDLLTMRFTYSSPSVMTIRGFTPEEAIELSLEETLSPSSYRTVIKALAEEMAREKEPGTDPNRHRTVEVEQICKDGTYAWCEVTMGFIRDGEGRPTGVLGVTRDISERKREEEERGRLEAILEESRKMESIGTLAGGIAHDFNNILMEIQGRTSLMLRGMEEDHPHLEHLRNIEGCVRSGADLTGQILGFARSGKYEVKTSDLNHLVGNSSDMFGRTRKEIVIHKEFQDGLWPADIDRSQIEQVLLNLYINAWHAMPSGGDLFLSTENLTTTEDFAALYGVQPGRYIKISVRDTGTGMDEKTRQRVFEPFFTTKEMGRGTGLGLASSYGIIRNHGGVITVTSRPAHGSTFTIYLPASNEAEIVEKVEVDEDAIEGTGIILLVDDEETVLHVGKQMLEEIGYRVLIARGGKEAIRIYEEEGKGIDLVILDMIMPEMGGRETFAALRTLDPLVKVLLSSGYSLTGEADRMLGEGCRGFMQKPFRLNDLATKVHDILSATP